VALISIRFIGIFFLFSSHAQYEQTMPKQTNQDEGNCRRACAALVANLRDNSKNLAAAMHQRRRLKPVNQQGDLVFYQINLNRGAKLISTIIFVSS
jgi:hypothetical protein